MMPIVVEGHEMHLLALDGVNFPEVRVLPVYPPSTGEGQVRLSPANRAEFLIKAIATPGTYRILQLAQTDQFLASAAKVIAEIVVGGPAKDMALPTKLPVQKRYFPVDPNPPITNERQHPVFRHLSAGGESVCRHRLHHQQQLLRRRGGAAGDGVRHHGNLEPGNRSASTMAEPRAIHSTSTSITSSR